LVGGMGSLYRSRHELVSYFATAGTLIATTLNSAGSAESDQRLEMARRKFSSETAQERSRPASKCFYASDIETEFLCLSRDSNEVISKVENIGTRRFPPR
jgi:hypothetical protein